MRERDCSLDDGGLCVGDVVFAESQARLVGAARSGEVRVAGHTELSRFRNSGRKFLEYWQNRRGRAGLPGFFDYDVGIEEIETGHIGYFSGYLKVTLALSYPFSIPSSFRNLVIGTTSEDSSLSSIWVRFDFEFSQNSSNEIRLVCRPNS